MDCCDRPTLQKGFFSCQEEKDVVPEERAVAQLGNYLRQFYEKSHLRNELLAAVLLQRKEAVSTGELLATVLLRAVGPFSSNELLAALDILL